MKKTILTLTTLMSFLPLAKAQSEVETIEIERSRAEESLQISLNESTVRCLVGDYGASSLKISIPQLRGLTVFRHTTRGEVEPCINAGACSREGMPGLDPSLIIDHNKPKEDVKVTIVLKEVLDIDSKLKTCQRSLNETVESEVRGLKFSHWDGRFLGDLDYDVCLKMKELNSK